MQKGTLQNIMESYPNLISAPPPIRTLTQKKNQKYFTELKQGAILLYL